jgi:excisionase family DNA binding protein
MAEWISVTEAAQLTGYHPEHLRELIREGRVKARKFATVWQIDQASLLAYMRAAEESTDKRRGPKKAD